MLECHHRALGCIVGRNEVISRLTLSNEDNELTSLHPHNVVFEPHLRHVDIRIGNVNIHRFNGADNRRKVFPCP